MLVLENVRKSYIEPNGQPLPILECGGAERAGRTVEHDGGLAGDGRRSFGHADYSDSQRVVNT